MKDWLRLGTWWPAQQHPQEAGHLCSRGCDCCLGNVCRIPHAASDRSSAELFLHDGPPSAFPEEQYQHATVKCTDCGAIKHHNRLVVLHLWGIFSLKKLRVLELAIGVFISFCELTAAEINFGLLDPCIYLYDFRGCESRGFARRGTIYLQ